MNVQPWEVHYFFNTHTYPTPKNKFIVVAYVDTSAGWFYGLFINSRVSRFVQARPPLAPCMVDLQQQTHPFLHHDSVVDCTTANVYQVNEVSTSSYRGSLDARAIAAVCAGVRACPALRNIIKKRIAP